MAYRNKTYVAFDGDSDLHFYNLMKAWKANDNIDFNFYDAHEINTARDSSSPETIKRRLRERMDSAKLFVLLVSKATKENHEFLEYEIDLALEKQLPLIVVNINDTNKRKCDYDLCPSKIIKALGLHISFNPTIMQYAIDNWYDRYRFHQENGDSGPYYYSDEIYSKLGL